MEIESIEIAKILVNEEFNCRSKINPMTCISLAKDIKSTGLLQPVVVKPYSDPEAPQYEYMLIIGHRRITAVGMNGESTINCTIRRDLQDEESAFVANVQENLNREDLNLLEEAMIVGRFIAYGLNRSEIHKKIGKSEGWVQSRTQMFNLPVEVQKEIVIHKIPISDVRKIYSTYTKKPIEDVYAHVRGVKEGKKNPLQNIKKPKTKETKRIRNRTELQDMMNHIREEGAGPCILTRLLAWASGSIQDGEFDLDLKNWHDEEGLDYTPLFDDGSEDYM